MAINGELNIRSPEAGRLASEQAELRGAGAEAAFAGASSSDVKRERPGDASSIVERLEALSTRIEAVAGQNRRSPTRDEIDEMFDP